MGIRRPRTSVVAPGARLHPVNLAITSCARAKSAAGSRGPEPRPGCAGRAAPGSRRVTEQRDEARRVHAARGRGARARGRRSRARCCAMPSARAATLRRITPSRFSRLGRQRPEAVEQLVAQALHRLARRARPRGACRARGAGARRPRTPRAGAPGSAGGSRDRPRARGSGRAALDRLLEQLHVGVVADRARGCRDCSAPSRLPAPRISRSMLASRKPEPSADEVLDRLEPPLRVRRSSACSPGISR